MLIGGLVTHQLISSSVVGVESLMESKTQFGRWRLKINSAEL